MSLPRRYSLPRAYCANWFEKIFGGLIDLVSRCTVCDWWQNFVDELDKVRLVSRDVIQHGVERIRSWIENQVGPSLYVLMKTMGIIDIYNIAASSAGRISAQQEALITDFQSLCLARRAAL